MRSGATSSEVSRPCPAGAPMASPNRSPSRAWMRAASSAISGTHSDRLALANQPALALDLLLQLHQALGERFRPRRAAGHVDVDRDDLVDAVADRVRQLEEAAAIGAAAHRDRVLG